MKITENDIVFIKHSPKARIPLRPEGNLSFRVYPCLHDDYIIIEKGKTITIDMGISCYISPDKYIQIHEDFRTNYYGLKISPIIIESNPRFRWHLTITNLNNKTIILSNNKLNHKEIVAREMEKQKKYFKKIKFRKKLRNAFIYDCRSYIAIATVHEFPKINNIIDLTYEEYKKNIEEDCNI